MSRQLEPDMVADIIGQYRLITVIVVLAFMLNNKKPFFQIRSCWGCQIAQNAKFYIMLL